MELRHGASPAVFIPQPSVARGVAYRVQGVSNYVAGSCAAISIAYRHVTVSVRFRALFLVSCASGATRSAPDKNKDKRFFFCSFVFVNRAPALRPSRRILRLAPLPVPFQRLSSGCSTPRPPPRAYWVASMGGVAVW